MPITVQYNYILVVLSVVIGVSATYAALDLGPRIAEAQGRMRLIWLTGGACAVGIGFWSMHFTGMLAFSLPVPVDYDWPTVLLSLLSGIFAAGFSLFVLSRKSIGMAQIASAGAVVGAALIAVHNVGMRAMRMASEYRYNFGFAALAVMLAICVSFLGLWFGFHFRDEIRTCGWRKIAGALVIGAAISSVHYSAMAATTFWPSARALDLSHAISISTMGAVAITTTTLLIQVFAMMTSFADRRVAAQRVEQLSSQLRYSYDEARRRIGRDLHDDVGQSLYALKLSLGRLRESVTDFVVRQSLTEAVDMAATSMDKIRTIARLLYPPELETLGFRGGIIVYVEGFRERSGVRVDLEIATPLPHLPRVSEGALLSVMQECLLNVVRHSGSRNVEIKIREEANFITLEVSDHGHGMPPDMLHRLQNGAGSGVGTSAMANRMQELGGRLEITSGASGTSVKALIPLLQ
jgi:signal transduction histidine kinase